MKLHVDKRTSPACSEGSKTPITTEEMNMTRLEKMWGAQQGLGEGEGVDEMHRKNTDTYQQTDNGSVFGGLESPRRH